MPKPIGAARLDDQSRSEHRARQVEIATFVLVVGSAVAVDPWGWSAFVTLRWAVVSTAGLLLVAAVLWAGRLRIHRTSAIGWLAFLGWAALSGIGALDPLYTWIGTPDRHLGFVALVLFALLYVAGQHFTERDDTIVLLKAAVLALLAIGLYTLFEVLGLTPVDPDPPSSRPGGPYGTAAYLGAATTLLLPVSIGAAVDGLGHKGWRNVAVAAGGLGAFAALAAQTRAGWVGLIAAVLISLPALATWLRRRWAVVGAAALLLLIVAVLSPIGGRALAAFDFNDGTARGRIDEWQVGARVAVNHPVAGVGLEGYRIAFAEGVDADYEQRYTRVATPDRAHNGALDVAVTTGLPGMALYLAAIGFLLRRAWLGMQRRQPWLVGLAAGVTGYIAQQWFLFPIAEVDPIFWLFAGSLVAATARGASISFGTPRWLVGALIVLAVASGYVGARDVVADRHTAEAAQLASTFIGSGPALQEADAAIALRPDSIRYRFAAALAAAAADSEQGLRDALERIEGGLEISPGDPILRKSEASLRLRLAQEIQNEAELARAVELWEGLVRYDPFHAEYRFQLGGAYAISGNIDAAARQLMAAADLAPRDPAPLVRLATLYINAGLLEEGEALFNELAARGLTDAEIENLRNRLSP